MLDFLADSTLAPELRTIAASKLLGAPRPLERKSALDYLSLNTDSSQEWPSIETLVSRTGNVEAGVQVFQQFCSSCHQVGGQGTAFGPELTEIGNKLGKDAERVHSRELLDNSLMTSNLHQAMGEEKLTDLVEYLASLEDYRTLHENPNQGVIRYTRDDESAGE